MTTDYTEGQYEFAAPACSLRGGGRSTRVRRDDVSSSSSNMVTPATAPASSSAAGSPLMLGVAFAVGVLVGGTTLAKRWAKMEKAKAVAPTMQ